MSAELARLLGLKRIEAVVDFSNPQIVRVEDVVDLEEGPGGDLSDDEILGGPDVEVVDGVVPTVVPELRDELPGVQILRPEQSADLDEGQRVLLVEPADPRIGEAGGPLESPSQLPVSREIGDGVESGDVALIVVQKTVPELRESGIVSVLRVERLRLSRGLGEDVASIHLPLAA